MDYDKFIAIIILLLVITFFTFVSYLSYSSNAAKIKQLEIITSLYEKGKFFQEVYLLKIEQLK